MILRSGNLKRETELTDVPINYLKAKTCSVRIV